MTAPKPLTPAGLDRTEWEIRPVGIDVSRRLVTKHHYARGASNTATYLHGLFKVGELWDENCRGVAWWIPPTKSAAQATHHEWQGVLSLSRLVITPDVPSNGCSFLVGGSMRMIDRERWPCLVTYADAWQGHTGAIYLATNWKYVGDTKPERTYTFDGRMMGRKRGGRTMRHAEMMAAGAVYEGSHAKRKFVHKVAL